MTTWFPVAQSSCMSIPPISWLRIWWRHSSTTILDSKGTSSCKSKRQPHVLWILSAWSPNTYWLSQRWMRSPGSQILYFRSLLSASWRNNSVWCLKLQGWIFGPDAAGTQISCLGTTCKPQVWSSKRIACTVFSCRSWQGRSLYFRRTACLELFE